MSRRSRHRHKQSHLFHQWRHYFVVALFFLCVSGLIWRLVFLTVIDRDFLQRQGDARTIREVEISAYRGMITDRNGEPLAISTPVDSVWANPQEFAPSSSQFTQLAEILKLSPINIRERVDQMKTREFLYLERSVTPSIAEEVKALEIPGVYLQREFRRYYPEGAMTAHLLGFTNIDDRGQEGLELAYNDWLAGISGKRRVLKDRLGNIVADIKLLREARSGHNLALSIDRRIQYIAYQELQKAIETFDASSGSVVVLDVRTGEVLAMVNAPSFNPNRRSKKHDDRYRNRAVTDVFEPGSVIKAFSVASALETGKYQADTLIDTNPGRVRVGRNTIKDIHNYGLLTVSGVLERSSNVGVSKMVLSQSGDNLWDFLQRVGFSKRTGSGFPGERSGMLQHPREWQPFVLATMAFGYAMTTTPLQLANAYSVFATGGIKYPVSFVRLDKAPGGERVMNEGLANTMLGMLEGVVEKGGTGRRARIPGYHVAGKTATARMVGPRGYETTHHVASFVGIAPVKQPRLVIVVVITDPQGKSYYASVVAAPVFQRVMAKALRILNVSPTQKSG